MERKIQNEGKIKQKMIKNANKNENETKQSPTKKCIRKMLF